MAVKTIDRGELGALLVEQDFDTTEQVDAWVMFDRWLMRGDGVAVYENVDLGHPGLGHKQFISFGSDAATLVGEEAPQTLPDFPTQINWRYQLVATHRPQR